MKIFSNERYLKKLSMILKKDSQLKIAMTNRINRMNFSNYIVNHQVRNLIDQTNIKSKQDNAEAKIIHMFKINGDIDLFKNEYATRKFREYCYEN